MSGTMAKLDDSAFPTIVDLIFEYAERDALFILRRVSREWRDKADVQLVRHIRLCHANERWGPGYSILGPSQSLPRQDWISSAIADSVRFLDVSPSMAVPPALCRLRNLRAIRDWSGKPNTPTLLMPWAPEYIVNRFDNSTFYQKRARVVVFLPFDSPTCPPLVSSHGSHGCYSLPRPFPGSRARQRFNSPLIVQSARRFTKPLDMHGGAQHAPHSLTVIIGARSRVHESAVVTASGQPDSETAAAYFIHLGNILKRVAKLAAISEQPLPVLLVNFAALGEFVPATRVSRDGVLVQLAAALRSLRDWEPGGLSRAIEAIEYLTTEEYLRRVGLDQYEYETWSPLTP